MDFTVDHPWPTAAFDTRWVQKRSRSILPLQSQNGKVTMKKDRLQIESDEQTWYQLWSNKASASLAFTSQRLHASKELKWRLCMRCDARAPLKWRSSCGNYEMRFRGLQARERGVLIIIRNKYVITHNKPNKWRVPCMPVCDVTIVSCVFR